MDTGQRPRRSAVPVWRPSPSSSEGSTDSEEEICWSVKCEGEEVNNSSFYAGQIKYFLENWKSITRDPFILNMVKGATIPLVERPDSGISDSSTQVRGDQISFVDKEIVDMLKKGVIEESIHEEGEIISPTFVVPKDDGSYRLILNLKKFNEKVEYEHFKMENFLSATELVTENCYLASVDLRHAYYSVPIHPNYRKYLKFQWEGKLYAYTCMPNGLSNCPRYFTKLLKPVYATLRNKGHLSVAFIDDSCLIGSSYAECKENVMDTVKLFESLGFVVHYKKSVLEPCQKLKFLGFWIDSKLMKVTLTEEKVLKVKSACEGLLQRRNYVSIRQLAQTIGILVSCFPAVFYGPLHFRNLEHVKSKALKENAGNFDAFTSLSREAITELQWWHSEVKLSYFPLIQSNPDIEISVDASNMGWGSCCLGSVANGRWSNEEANLHINALEMLAIEYALRSFENQLCSKHVKIFSDNQCAVSYIRNMGGSKSMTCNNIAFNIWSWCIKRNILLTISHVAGVLNRDADLESRRFLDRTEWMLRCEYFQSIIQIQGQPDIDLFASRLNFQMKPFVSWGPDPDSKFVDAFTLNWGEFSLVYAFPPFSLLTRVLRKFLRDQAEGICIVPLWRTAVWFPVLLSMVTEVPLILPRGRQTLVQPHTGEPHPLHKSLDLVACRVSGKTSRNREFLQRLSTSSYPHGDQVQYRNITLTCPSGFLSVKNKVSIPMNRLLYQR